MPTDGPQAKHPPSDKARRIRVLGAAGASVLALLGVLTAARIPIAEHLIADALKNAGLRDVSVSVTRLNAGRLTIGGLSAENGALDAAGIDAVFTPFGLLRARLDSLAVDKLDAVLTWDGAGLKLGSFPLELREDAPPLRIPAIGAVNAPAIALRIDTPSASLRAPLSLSARAVDDKWDTTIKGAVEGPGVAVVADWGGVIVPADPAQSAGQGRFDLDIAGLAVPGVTERFDARGLVTLDAKDGVFAVTVNRPLTFAFAPPAPAFQGLPALNSLGTVPWSITIAPSQSDAALVFSGDGAGRQVKFDIAAVARAGDGRLSLDLAGTAARGTAAGTSLQLSAARADIQSLPVGGGRISGYVAASEFTGTLTGAKGNLDAALTLAGVTVGSLMLEDANANMTAAVDAADGNVTMNFKALQVSMSRASLGDWTLAQSATLGLSRTAKAAQSVWANLLGAGFGADLALTLPEARLHDKNDKAASLVVRAPDIRVRPGADAALVLSAGNLALAHTAVEIAEGRLDATLNDGTVSAKAAARVTRIGPAEEGKPGNAALAATAALTTRGDDFDLRGTFATAAGAKLGDFSARVRRDLSRGTATFSMPKTRFERGGKFDAVDLAFIAPAQDLTGIIGLEAKAAWASGSRTESATATLEDVSFAVGEVSIAGLSTTVELAGLMPPRSAAPHRLTVQSIAAGLPLTGLAAEFNLPGDGTAMVGKGSVDVAGGQITMTGAALPLDGGGGSFALGVQRIDMGQLAALAKIDGLSVTGTLSGSVPLRSDDSGFHFADGVLRADAPGKLVYKPATPPEALSQSGGGALLLQALSNFAYDRLSITLNGPVTEDISLLVGLAGKNPDLYGGYPIEFNLNLSGRLTQILRQGLVGYGVPADIERQIREGQRPKQ